jgi:hypothetical protein
MKPLNSSAFALAGVLAAIMATGCAHMDDRQPSASEIHQVGLVWLKQPGHAADRQKVVDAVHEFGRSIPEVRAARVGRTDGIGGPFSDTSYDVCFILTFADEAARQRYNEHPVHQKAAQEVFLPLAKDLRFYRFVGE